MKWFLMCAMGLFTLNSALVAEAEVELKQAGSTVQVTINGKEFTVLNYGKDLPKPFFSPVRSPGGQIITRPLENPEDHKHHKGIWFSVDEVSGSNFWNERSKIENVSVKVITAKGNPAEMVITNHWLNSSGQPLVIETTNVKIFDNYVLAYDTKLAPGGKSVVFNDTKEGLFGIRLKNGMREKENGRVINSHGAKHSKGCWGKIADWVDYTGPVDGKLVGVAIFDHHSNFRPSRYHVRDYGLFSISPFGESAYTQGAKAASPVELKAGQSLRLRYAMYIHQGDHQSANVSAAYRQYLDSTH